MPGTPVRDKNLSEPERACPPESLALQGTPRPRGPQGLCLARPEEHARSSELACEAHSGAVVAKLTDLGALSTLNLHPAFNQLRPLSKFLLLVSAFSSVKWELSARFMKVMDSAAPLTVPASS